MARPPVESGEIPDGGAIELLRELETQSLTGLLQFESIDGAVEGEIVLYGGEIAVDQPAREDGKDPVDLFLALGPARYRLLRRLPPLPVAKGDDYTKSGSLAVHVPADLMNYCEHAGLTGVLELRHEGRKAEAIYRAGELLAIELDGEDAGDLQEVFGWEQGRFRIELDVDAPSRIEAEEEEVGAPTAEWKPVPPKKREDTRQFLRVVEMALADVVTSSEKARSPTRTSPPMPPPPKARPRPKTVPPPKPRRSPNDQTVRLIYLTGDPPAEGESDTSTRHVRANITAEFALTEAQPERRAAVATEPESMAKKRKKKSPKKAAPKTASARDDAEAKDAAKSPSAESAAAAEAPETSPATDEKRVAERAAAKKPEKKRSDDSPPDDRKKEADPVMTGTLLGTAGWTLGFFGVGLLVLMFLSYLPPVSCPPGRETCGWGTGCVSTSNDPEHCGACGNVCASGRCVFGECAE